MTLQLLVMMASKSSLPFACLVISSIGYSHIHGSVHLSSDSDLTNDVYLKCYTSLELA